MDHVTENNFIAQVIKRSMGLPPKEIPSDFHSVGASLPRWHLQMLQDRRRMEYYSDIIKTKVQDKIVLDIGTGSGILSHLALRWGAKKVYSVEQNPALAAVYRHLMREPLATGKAELIVDDARYLRKEQFADGLPDLIVHELFGCFGMGENLIPIFRGLTEEGIIIPKTDVTPDCLEVWAQPVFSQELSQDVVIEAFEGYALNELNIFGYQNFWEQDYQASRHSKWQNRGDSQMLFKCNLRDLLLPETTVMSVKAADCSHLKLWMKIVDTKSGLVHSNDHDLSISHWTNAILTIPHWLRGKDFKVEFRVNPDHLDILRYF